jgi:acylphosphatase
MKPVSDRELAYKEIVEAHKERLAAEAEAEPVIEAEIEPPQPEVEAQPVSQPEEPQGEPEVETPALVPTEPAAPQLVKAKVDAVEYDVPQEEIDKAGSVAQWQLQKATENRLKELNEIIKAAKAQTQTPQAQPQQNHDAELDAEVEALRYGDPEQARRILKELKAAKVPQDQIVREAVQHIKWENAVEQFAKEHEELLKDPDVRIVAVALENQLRQYMDQTKQWPDFARFYKDLGTHIQSKFGKPAAVDLDARRELKATIAEPKTASGRVPTPPPPKAKTTADIINEQRKARGQPIH